MFYEHFSRRYSRRYLFAGESKCRKESFRSRYLNYHIVMKMRSARCHVMEEREKNNIKIGFINKYLVCRWQWKAAMNELWNLAILISVLVLCVNQKWHLSHCRKVWKFFAHFIMNETANKVFVNRRQYLKSYFTVNCVVIGVIAVCFPFLIGVNAARTVPVVKDKYNCHERFQSRWVFFVWHQNFLLLDNSKEGKWPSKSNSFCNLLCRDKKSRLKLNISHNVCFGINTYAINKRDRDDLCKMEIRICF